MSRRHRSRLRILFTVYIHPRGKWLPAFVEQKVLKPGVNKMAPVMVTVGHVVDCSIFYFDQNGNPMLVTPTPDSPPVWSDAPAPAGCTTFVVAPDGMSAIDTAVAVGADVVSLSVMVGGKTFTATLPVTISASPQVLTSVAIGAVVV